MTARTITPHIDHLTDAPQHPVPAPRARRVAFRVVAVVVTLVLAPLVVFGLSELVLMWLPAATVLATIDDPSLGAGDVEMHRTHFLAGGLLAIAYLPSLFVQLRRPERRVAPLMLLVLMPTMGAVLFGLTGTFASWVAEELLILLPVLVLAALHPRARQLVQRPTFEPRMAALAALVSVPLVVSAARLAALQRSTFPVDPHAAMEHWASMALVALTIAAAAGIGATRLDGWRVPAAIAVVVPVVLAVHGLRFPDAASALTAPAAVALILWALVYAAAALVRSRRDADIEAPRSPTHLA